MSRRASVSVLMRGLEQLAAHLLDDAELSVKVTAIGWQLIEAALHHKHRAGDDGVAAVEDDSGLAVSLTFAGDWSVGIRAAAGGTRRISITADGAVLDLTIGSATLVVSA